MPAISAATLNLHGREDRWHERRELIVSELVDRQPDIIGLQKVYRPLGQARWLKNQVNSRITGRSEGLYFLAQRRKRQLAAGYFEGLAVLSKLPIVNVDHLGLGYGGNLALRVNLEIPSRNTLDFITVRLDSGPEYREARLEQVLRLQGWLQGRDLTQAQVIAGDFGEKPEGRAIQQMKQVYRSAFEEARSYELIASYPTALLNGDMEVSQCLDYIFISGAAGDVREANIFCSRPSAGDASLYPSSHVGLMAEIILPN